MKSSLTRRVKEPQLVTRAAEAMLTQCVDTEVLLVLTRQRASRWIERGTIDHRPGNRLLRVHVCTQRDAVEVDSSRTRLTEC